MKWEEVFSWSKVMGNTLWNPLHCPSLSGIWSASGGEFQRESTNWSLISPVLSDSPSAEKVSFHCRLFLWTPQARDDTDLSAFLPPRSFPLLCLFILLTEVLTRSCIFQMSKIHFAGVPGPPETCSLMNTGIKGTRHYTWLSKILYVNHWAFCMPRKL